MFSHAFKKNIAGSRGICLSNGLMFKHLPRDPVSVNQMKKKPTCDRLLDYKKKPTENTAKTLKYQFSPNKLTLALNFRTSYVVTTS